MNIEKIITGLDAAGGLPDLPFTDLVRDPKGLDLIRSVLLSFDWHVTIDANDGFVLGDTAVLYEKKYLESGVRAPLSKSMALYLTPSHSPRKGIASSVAKPFEVNDLNYESAARARLWLVGEQTRIEAVRTQISAQGLPSV